MLLRQVGIGGRLLPLTEPLYGVVAGRDPEEEEEAGLVDTRGSVDSARSLSGGVHV